MDKKYFLTEEEKKKVVSKAISRCRKAAPEKNLDQVEKLIECSEKNFDKFSQDFIRMSNHDTGWNRYWMKSCEIQMIEASIGLEFWKQRKEELEDELKELIEKFQREVDAAVAAVRKEEAEAKAKAESEVEEVERINPEDIVIEG